MAPDPTMHYGDPVPALAPSYSGFVNGDTPASLTTQPTCTTTATSSSPVGTYPVTCSGAVDPNYTFTYVPGSLSVGPAQLTVTADNKSIVYGAAIPPLTYKITGFVNGDAASVVTGSANCTTTATTASPAGSYPITCTIGSLAAANYSFGFAAGTLTVAKHPATIGYTGGLFFATNPASATSAPVLLQAQVVQQANGAPGDLTRAAVRFLLYRSANTAMTTPDTIVPAAVDATGKASATTTLGIDNWTVIAQIDPANGFFSAPNADPQVVTVYQPTTGTFATGGGWIVDPGFQNIPVAISPSNNHGSFGFVVRYDKKGGPQGQAVYTFRGVNGYDYVVKSTSWQGGGASFGPTTVSFAGKANVTVIDPSTGLVVAALSGGNYTYRVDATSGSSPTYAISIYLPSGSLYHQAGTSKSQIRLGGGNIVVHH
jgi:hypothetical protein